MNRRQLLSTGALLAFPALAHAEPDRTTRLISAARSQVGKTVSYDPAYSKITYPGGDVPMERGVCTDVVIRAYRQAFGIDLQELVHEDMAKNLAFYPKIWGLKRADSNIDHRRVPNLRRFFERNRAELHISKVWPAVEPGDIVTIKLPGNLDHIGIVSDKLNEKNAPYLIHNIGRGTQEEEVLFQFPHTGRYRFALL